MKTKSILFAAVLVAGFASGAVAKEDPTNANVAVVSAKGSELVKVIYKGVAAGKVKVNVYSDAHQLVFSETRSSGDGFILPLNFKGLDAGQYSVEITDASGVKTEKINYQPTVTKAAVHVARLAGSDKYLVSVAKATSNDITVRIYDKDNNLVHISTKEAAGDFAQVFSIKNHTGSYTFEVTDGQGQTTVVNL